MLLRSNKHYYEAIDGTIKYVSQLSLFQRENFRIVLSQLDKQLKQHQDKSFSDAMEQDKMLAALVTEALQIAGVSVNDVNLDQMYCMLFPHQIEEYWFEEGILVSINFPKPKESTQTLGAQPGKAKSIANVVGTIAATMENLMDTLKAIEELPADLLIDILNERAFAMLPEAEKTKLKAKEMAQELKASGEHVSFGDEIDPSALGF